MEVIQTEVLALQNAYWEKVVRRLFIKLESIYLTRWTQNFRSEDALMIAIETWAQMFITIKQIDVHVIKIAIERCIDRFEWPPTLLEFKRLCKEIIDQKMPLINTGSSIPTQDITIAKETLAIIKNTCLYPRVSEHEYPHPRWPAEKIERNNREYDEKIYNERKNYLINVSEWEAHTLCGYDYCDRRSYLNELMSTSYVGINNEFKWHCKPIKGSVKVFRDWLGD